MVVDAAARRPLRSSTVRPSLARAAMMPVDLSLVGWRRRDLDWGARAPVGDEPHEVA